MDKVKFIQVNEKSLVKQEVSVSQRIYSIDALRGMIMLVMLLDHVRGLFYSKKTLAYPINVDTTEPFLFWTRWISHFCAPIFIFLTGLATWLYHQKYQNIQATRLFLLKRGVFLIMLEFAVCNFYFLYYKSYTMQLQVIWAIGVRMIILSGLLLFPRVIQLLLVICLTVLPYIVVQINIPDILWLREIWIVLYQVPAVLHLTDTITIDVLYPVLPWIAVIYGGYLLGPMFAKNSSPSWRTRMLCAIGGAMILISIILRLLNRFGDSNPWTMSADTIRMVMSFLNFSKYPPSVDLLLITIGTGLLLLAAIENVSKNVNRLISPFIVLGSVPLFFYVLHLYIILGAYLLADLFVGGIARSIELITVWFITLALSLGLYPFCKRFSDLKHSSKKPWMS